MFKKIFIISCAVLGIAGLPQYAQDLSRFTDTDAGAPNSAPASVQAAKVTKAAQAPRAHYTTGVRAASIPMDRAGHFSADFRINGRNVRGLIDTGATYVALNASTARNLGLGLTSADFKHEVNTANGKTRAALVVLDRMDVGSISVNRVEAFVLDDKALSSTLIGMSFMSKLDSYRVRGNTLELAL
ncbi:TIGR02281 family clan AA aspartic protease [uncultured Hoeflea sp.]|uniref:retropepsin-like aspartic protease family protein n=1 Tax=uncultured Hoeflea sp. TaxID=538666 RepID=UPI002625AE67|nr:TIGR02281 family clan AA aspartic protease [uncultured Hoeflea sp.]